MKKKLLLSVTGALMLAGCGGDGLNQGQSQEPDQDATIQYNDLEWKVGPDIDMNWHEADEWAESLGGGWRLPTRAELGALFDAGITRSNLGPFQNSGWGVWSLDSDSSHGWNFDFINGDEYHDIHSVSGNLRAFAVRSPR